MNKNNRTFRKQHYSSLYFYSSSICIDWGGEVPIPQGCDTKGILDQPVEKKNNPPILSNLGNRGLTPALPETHQQKNKQKKKHPFQLKSL